MVEITRALRAFLLADATIAAAVGTRIYPQKLPQAVTYPAITILRVSAPRANVLHGPASLARPRYQIDCWVQEKSGISAFEDSQELGGLVLARLEGYNGVMTDPKTATDYYTGVTFDDERDLFDPDVNGGYFHHAADYFIWHGVQPVGT